MRAKQTLAEKTLFDDGTILEVRIWSVPSPVPPAVHHYKYSLFYRRPVERIVAFDNERGKGDYRHIRDVETSYSFVSIQQLLHDFRLAVEHVKGTGI